jgi:tricorn protease
VTAPRIAIYGLHGDWDVENVGVAPDVEVESDPKSVAAGRDPRLERAVALTLEALKNQLVVFPPRPKYPNYDPRSGNP